MCRAGWLRAKLLRCVGGGAVGQEVAQYAGQAAGGTVMCGLRAFFSPPIALINMWFIHLVCCLILCNRLEKLHGRFICQQPSLSDNRKPVLYNI